MTRLARWLVGFGVLFGWFCLAIPTVQAQTANQPKYSVQNLTVTATLDRSGQVTVRQQITFTDRNPLNWSIFTNVRQLAVEADGQPVNQRQYSVTAQADHQLISSDNLTLAKVWQLTYVTTTTLIRTNEQDRIFLKLIDQPGRSINTIHVSFQLPDSLTTAGLFGNLYALQGANNPHSQIVAPNRIDYDVNLVSSVAIVTINANWPKTVLRLNPLQELRLFLSNLAIVPWLILGLFLPLLAMAVLARLWMKQRQGIEPVLTLRETPPSTLAPILVGVVVSKKVYPEEIVALIVDLCQRGYLLIVKKHRQYFLSQRKEFDQYLEPWEQRILAELFPTTTARVSPEKLKALSRESLYSPNVRDAFSEIYNVITQLDYFSENPHLTRVKYKLVALSFYFTASLGLIWVAVAGVSPYLLIPLIGSLAISYLIIRLTPQLIRYTAAGLEARREWLSFANFLGYNRPLPIADALDKTFDRYLPYAIALHKTTAWGHRFDLSNRVLLRPDWLVNFEESENSAEEYAKQVSQFAESLSELLSSMRGPLVS